MENNDNSLYDEERIYINPVTTKRVGKTKILEGFETTVYNYFKGVVYGKK